MSKDNDNDIHDDFKSKNARYKAEQNKIFRNIKKKIKYDEDANTFDIDNIDRDYILKDVYPQLKKYFYFDTYGRIDIDNPKSHISIVKKLFAEKGYKLLLIKVPFVDDNGKKKKIRKYYVT